MSQTVRPPIDAFKALPGVSGGSGIALIGSNSYLTVNDGDLWEIEREPLAVRKVDAPAGTSFADLESVCSLKGRSGHLLLLESAGTVIMLKRLGPGQYDWATLKRLSLGSALDLEGLDHLQIDGSHFLVWSQRGDPAQPGKIFWGAVDFDALERDFLADIREAEFSAQALDPGANISRHISDLRILSDGRVFVLSHIRKMGEEDRSALSFIGRFVADASHAAFEPSPAPELLVDYQHDFKTEGFEFGEGRLVMITDGEGQDSMFLDLEDPTSGPD